jgi:hypothetical protein
VGPWGREPVGDDRDGPDLYLDRLCERIAHAQGHVVVAVIR